MIIDIQYRVEITPIGGKKIVLKDVTGDGIDKDLGFRFFTRVTGEMIHVPLNSVVFFGKERMLAIEKNIKDEAGK